MEAPIVLRTMFGEQSDPQGFFNDALINLCQQADWCERVLVEDSMYAGPFCYTPWEQAIPF
jgi:hypothetical protein